MSYRVHLDKPDANCQDVVDVLRAVGAGVWYIGRPLDLLVAFRGEFSLLEVKKPGEELSDSQQETFYLMEACGCKPHRVESPGDALRAIGAIGGV